MRTIYSSIIPAVTTQEELLQDPQYAWCGVKRGGHTKVYCTNAASRTSELCYEIDMGSFRYSFLYSFSKYVLSMYSVLGTVLVSGAADSDAHYKGKRLKQRKEMVRDRSS